MSRFGKDDAVRERMRVIANQRRRFGYWRLRIGFGVLIVAWLVTLSPNDWFGLVPAKPTATSLLTGMRVSELPFSRWNNVDAEPLNPLVPAPRTRQSLHVTLAQAALEVIEALPRRD